MLRGDKVKFKLVYPRWVGGYIETIEIVAKGVIIDSYLSSEGNKYILKMDDEFFKLFNFPYYTVLATLCKKD